MSPPAEPRSSWLLWAGAATAGAAGAYWLMAPGAGRRGSGARAPLPAEQTDFAGFLADPARLAAAQAAAAAAPAHHTRTARGGTAAADSTDFAGFLRVAPAPAAADPTGFDSFLKAAPSAAAGAAAGASAAAAAEEVPADRARVVVMYGTEYGFSKEIAEKLAAQLKAGDAYWPALVNMADHPSGYDFSREQAVFMVCSTQGDGVPPTESREFCDWLFAGGAGPQPQLAYSVLALGDRTYPHFCRCGKQLDAALAASGAKEAAPRADIDKEDWAAIDAWLAGVAGALPGLGLRSMSETGFGAGSAEPAAAAAGAKRYTKARPYFARVRALEGLCTISDKAADKDTVRVELDLGDSGLAYLPGDALGIYPTNPPEAVEELLAQLGADADTLVPVPSWHYAEPEGHATVTKGADGAPAMPLRAALSRCYDLRTPRGDALLALLSGALASGGGAAAAGAPAKGKENGVANGGGKVHLEAYVNGNGAPHANGNSAAANGGGRGKQGGGGGAAAAEQAARLAQLAGDKGALEAYLAARHVVDVLRDFPAAAGKLSAQQLLPALRQLQPRLYSISSSPLEDAAGVQATIAVVRYESLGAERIGVCSTFVAERSEVGAFMPVFISKNPDFRLPADPATPVIMVGPGTGLAPFRAFITHRLLEAGLDPKTLGAGGSGSSNSGQAAGTSGGAAAGGAGEGGAAAAAYGPVVLYFGCRRRDQDYLYGSDLERWAAAGAIELHAAFSRQPGAPKVYVQQRLEETGDRVWQLLEAGAHFYICGDASAMAPAVEAALLRVIAARLPSGGGEAAAKAYFDKLVEQHRFERDVWFG